MKSVTLIYVIGPGGPAADMVAEAAARQFASFRIVRLSSVAQHLALGEETQDALVVLTDPAEGDRDAIAELGPTLRRPVLLRAARAGGEGTVAVGPGEWMVSVLARVLHGMDERMRLASENDRLRGDLRTVARRIAHDLRTPLGGIVVTGEILKEVISERSPDDASMADSLFESTDSMVKLIERISFLLRASAGEEALVEVKMADAVHAAMERVELQVSKAGATVTQPDGWPSVRGVAAWVVEIWANLISNAVQHGGPHAQVEIGCDPAGASIRFWARDHGPGIPESRRASLLAGFDMMHLPSAPSGLGLSIVRRLVDLQNGTCGIEQADAGGARVWFELPVAVAERPLRVENPEQEAARPVSVAPAAPTPEERRLALLRSCHLLDTPPDPEIDKFTSLISRLLKVPVALVSLVDEDRQFFKSAVGLPEPLATVRETPLSHSICKHVVDDGAALLISDARKDPRVQNNPSVSELGVTAYLGAPLRTVEGQSLGALCVIDTVPRAWTSEDVGTLELVSELLMHQIEMRRELVRRDGPEKAGLVSSGDAERLIEDGHDCVELLDEDGHLLSINTHGCALLEIDRPETMTGRYWPAFWPGEGLLAAEQALAAARSGGMSRFQGSCPTIKGAPKWWDVRVRAAPAAPDGKARLLVISRDITSERLARVRWRGREDRFQLMLDTGLDFAGILTPEGVLLEVSAAAIKRASLRDEDVIGVAIERTFWFSHSTEVQAGLRDAVNSAAAGEKVGHELLMRNGHHEFATLKLVLSPLFDERDKVTHLVATGVNISDVRRTEAALRESEGRLRTLADNISQFAWMADETGSIFWYNRRWFDYTGTTLEEMAGWGWQKVHHPEHITRVVEKFSLCLQTGEVWEDTFPLRGKEGGYRWFLSRALPIKDSSGKVLRWFGTNTDITEHREAIAALREREGVLSALFQQAGAGIVRTDFAGRFEMVNERYCEIVGRSEAELKKLTVEEITHPEDQAINAANLERLAAAGSSYVIEKRYIRPDRSIVWVRKSVTPLRDDGGAVRAAIAVVEDISDRMRIVEELRSRERQLSLVTDNANVMLAQLDRELRLTFVNRPCAERLRRKPEDILGHHLAEVLGPRVFDEIKSHLKAALDGERQEFEFSLLSEERGTVWMHVLYVPEIDADGSVAGVITVTTDISARKEAEIAVAEARDRALASSRAKDDFLAVLSHELRTPLNPVLLIASEAAANSALPPTVKKDFENIVNAVELEARLIDDLLDLTRITRGKLALDRSVPDIHAVLHDAVRTVRSRLEEKDLLLEVGCCAARHHVSGDPVRLQQVFWNVLNNAAKFTPRGGRIDVGTANPSGTDSIAITITDSGIGMDEAEMSRVFEAFSQGDHALGGSSRQFGGLGLGLAISRKLVELHDGRISVRSAGRGRGCSFVIELPCVAGPATEAPTADWAPDSSAAAAPLRILVVEDHEQTRVALTRLLQRRGYLPTPAASIAEALARAAAQSFDLVLSDIGLPDGTGHELMVKLRAAHGLTGIAITGYGMDRDIERSRAAGFAAHVTKPVRMEQLQRAIVVATEAHAG